MLPSLSSHSRRCSSSAAPSSGKSDTIFAGSTEFGKSPFDVPVVRFHLGRAAGVPLRIAERGVAHAADPAHLVHLVDQAAMDGPVLG